jgi:hypothetical protein
MKVGTAKADLVKPKWDLARAEAPEIARSCRSREGDATRARQKMSRAKVW